MCNVTSQMVITGTDTAERVRWPASRLSTLKYWVYGEAVRVEGSDDSLRCSLAHLLQTTEAHHRVASSLMRQ